MTREQAVAFLTEAATYFERRPTGGEDMTFWANTANADNCRKIAAMLSPDASSCTFCGFPAGDDSIMDDNGAIACKSCGEAEFKTQVKEGLR